MNNLNSFPAIRQAALAIAYDNGAVNRTRTEEQCLRACGRAIARFPAPSLYSINAWLAGLTEDELHVLTCGEESETSELIDDDAPAGIANLLNVVFEAIP